MSALEPLPQAPDHANVNLTFHKMKLKDVKPNDTMNGGIRILSIEKIRDRYHMTVKIGMSSRTSTLIMHKGERVLVRRNIRVPQKDLKDFAPLD